MARPKPPVVPLTPEQRQMVEEHINFAYFMANKLRQRIAFEYEELVSLCLEGLCKAVQTYDPEKGYKFINTAYLVIEHFVMNVARDTARHNISAVYLEDLLNTEDNLHWESILFADLRPLDDVIINSIDIESAFRRCNFTPTEKAILARKIADPEAGQRQFAKELGISQSRVSHLLKQITTKLKKQIA